MKYILVTGGVISGVGKGIIASSLGVILQSIDVRVSAIKIDPYLNIDAGTFSPKEHGEVFVLNDGAEVDLDLGNYERFLGLKLNRDNNITTGKIYQHVINKERRGDYLGKTVQTVPHITDCIQNWVERVAATPVDESGKPPQVCIIELGGTISDIEGGPFVEAFRQFQFRVKRENFVIVHVSLVPEVSEAFCLGRKHVSHPNQIHSSEQKTKPTQHSVRELRALGEPDVIVCRSTNPINNAVRDKISRFCQVEPTEVLSVHNTSNVYHVPLVLAEQNMIQYLIKRLQLDVPPVEIDVLPKSLLKWKELAHRYDSAQNKVRIALVGKYVQHADAYASVVKALYHAALCCDRSLILENISAENLEEDKKRTDPVKYHEAWQHLCSVDGVLVPGGFDDRGIEGMIIACHWARTQKKPLLGVCLGMQCAVIDFARSVLKLDGANSGEFDKNTKHKVVIDMPEHTQGQMGGTMRLGLRRTMFKPECTSVIRKLYSEEEPHGEERLWIEERHRHRYEVNPEYVEQLEANGLKFVGKASDQQEGGDADIRMEICELKDHPYFVGVQFHPEYLSQPLKPSPPYLGLILAAIGKLEGHLKCPRVPSALALVNGALSSSSSTASFHD